jgi:hypothetical protein
MSYPKKTYNIFSKFFTLKVRIRKVGGNKGFYGVVFFFVGVLTVEPKTSKNNLDESLLGL